MQPDADHLIVGYSGGLDSQVLLHGLATGRQRWPERRLEAIYIDHGLQAASVAWGEHCARICQALDVPFRIMRIDARPASGESPEAAARQARYAVFAAALGPNSALLTAHHRDDQAETLLLQLLRGAGPHGLAAMPAVSRLGEGRLLRPFLDRDRAELLAYAREHGLHWIEDASNTDIDFDRNYLRHRVLPLLRDRWPAANRTLARSARLCAETAAWLDEQAAADLVDVATDRPDCLSISGLGRLSEQRQRHVLRHWLRQLQLPIPDARQLRHLLQDTLTAAADRNPWVRWPGGEGRRYRDALYALSPLPLHDARQTYVWPSNADGWPPLDLAGVGQLRMQATIGTGLRAAGLSGGSLIVGFRQGGERFRPAGRAHGQELKKLLQEAGIPPWERDRLPLIYLPLASHRLASQLLPSREEGERLPEGCLLLAVVGLGVAAEAAAGPGELGWQPFV
ncbi:MAG: tRNA lysidine(34) synthetase TilS [Gammaproteobacteria bacterium]|nr:tRNA lysidine(34) synthetase TilS [Gammaproteobacteria bacterium]